MQVFSYNWDLCGLCSIDDQKEKLPVSIRKAYAARDINTGVISLPIFLLSRRTATGSLGCTMKLVVRRKVTELATLSSLTGFAQTSKL
jgi:hypothetical protein